MIQESITSSLPMITSISRTCSFIGKVWMNKKVFAWSITSFVERVTAYGMPSSKSTAGNMPLSVLPLRPSEIRSKRCSPASVVTPRKILILTIRTTRITSPRTSTLPFHTPLFSTSSIMDNMETHGKIISLPSCTNKVPAIPQPLAVTTKRVAYAWLAFMKMAPLVRNMISLMVEIYIFPPVTTIISQTVESIYVTSKRTLSSHSKYAKFYIR